MTTILTRYKGAIILVAGLAVAFFAYSYFFAKPAEPLLSAEAVSGTTSVDQDLISLLLELRSIKLDDSIFSDPAFISLQDFSQNLTEEPIGRVNPFAPLGARPLAPQGQ